MTVDLLLGVFAAWCGVSVLLVAGWVFVVEVGRARARRQAPPPNAGGLPGLLEVEWNPSWGWPDRP